MIWVIQHPITTERSTFQVNKRDHKILRRDKRKLAKWLERKQFKDQPKPMFKIVGKPLIQHVIENLKEAGVKNLVVVIGHNGEQIKRFLGDGKWLGVEIQYTVQDREQHQTPHHRTCSGP
jgi:hypothetical protein